MSALRPTTDVPVPLSEAERLDRLRLIRTENIGPITFRRLIERFGSAEAAIEGLPDLARAGGRRAPLKVASRASAVREIDETHALGADLVVFGDPDYPPALAAIEDAPVTLSVLGDPGILSARSVAIVGARNVSINGRQFAEHLAGRIGAGGYVVASGLARGIDDAAHRGSLATGTVAVLAGGVNLPYPRENQAVWADVCERGAVVSEHPVGTVPTARHFPARNRIIAGLSLGVVVVEAAARSGSLITARQALDQGRDVFAVPGSPLDPRSAGPNGLLKAGAAFLVENGEDVLQVLDGQPGPALSEAPAPDPMKPQPPGDMPVDRADPVAETTRRDVLLGLSMEPVPVDELIRRCQLSPPVVATILLEAELAGLIDRHPGNQVSRRGNTTA